MSVTQYQTHEVLIKRIKDKLKLPKPQSTFISRSSILTYIKVLQSYNQMIRNVLDPPSMESDVDDIQVECRKGLQKLKKLEEQEAILEEEIDRLKAEKQLMQSYLKKNEESAENYEREIRQLLGQKSGNSGIGEREEMQNLFDKFMNYFEEQEIMPTKTLQQLTEKVEQDEEKEDKNYQQLEQELKQTITVRSEPPRSNASPSKLKEKRKKLLLKKQTHTGFQD